MDEQTRTDMNETLRKQFPDVPEHELAKIQEFVQPLIATAVDSSTKQILWFAQFFEEKAVEMANSRTPGLLFAAKVLRASVAGELAEEQS